MRKFKKLLLYAGADKQKYEQLMPVILETDRKHLRFFSLITAVMFAVLGLMGLVGQSVAADNVLLYLITAAVMAAVFAGNEHYVRSGIASPLPEIILVDLFMLTLYAEAIAVTMRHPELPAVTFIGVLMVVPLLFVDKPYRVIIVQTAVVVAFCVLTNRVKERSVAGMDVWNAVTFLIPSIAEILIVIPLRVKSWMESQRIEYMSMHDIMTGVQNRTAYENELNRIDAAKEQGLVYIFADANGLHELNNTRGHEAGDIMLKTVAASVRENFGDTASYRIGGDEFVAICRGRSCGEIDETLKRMEEAFGKQDYHVSFGVASCDELPGADPRTLVKTAEQRMYEAKTSYYCRCGKMHR